MTTNKGRNSPSGSGIQFGLCAICKEIIVSDTTTTRCGHVFHGECIGRWLGNSTICPVCRTDLNNEELIKIYPGSQDRNEMPIVNSILTEDELKSLTLEAFKSQNIVYNQLSLLGDKLSEQTSYIEDLKRKLEDKDQKMKMVEGERERLEETLHNVTRDHEELQIAATKLRSENDCLENKLEEIDATVEYMDTLVEQHRADFQESRMTIGDLEDELATIQAACNEMEETMSKIQLIRYEVEATDDSDRPLDDFVEDLVAENCSLKQKVEDSAKLIEKKEYAILDLEISETGLRETLRDIQESYADQSSESKDMEDSLRTMQRLYKDQSEELQALKDEKDQYHSDVKDMLESLKKSEKNFTEVEAKRRQSELLNQSYEGLLAESKMVVEGLKKDKEDTMRMMGLKEDVIKTLQDSISSITTSYLNHLDKFLASSQSGEDASSLLSVEPGTSSGNQLESLTVLDDRFMKLAEELEKKDNLLIHLMNEKSTLEGERDVRNQIAEQELQDKIDSMTDRISKLEREIKDRDNSMEEKEMVIAHLVNVVNRYAFNDRISGATAGPKKRLSAPEGLNFTDSLSSTATTDESKKSKTAQKGSSLPASVKKTGAGFFRRSLKKTKE